VAGTGGDDWLPPSGLGERLLTGRLIKIATD
jgi:hypothetical protein